jgi:hypothetical protein
MAFIPLHLSLGKGVLDDDCARALERVVRKGAEWWPLATFVLRPFAGMTRIRF